MLNEQIKAHVRGIKADPKAQMRRGIRSSVRGLWSNVFGRTDFVANMEASIRRGLRSAWAEGAGKAGILENELTQDELIARENFISNQFSYIGGFADSIEASPKGVGKLTPFFERAEMWVNRYTDAVNQAFVMANENLKLKWFYGDTQHCEDCDYYNGKVYRAKVWARYGIRPQSILLACHGFKCKCEFVETDEPVTPGRPKKMKYM